MRTFANYGSWWLFVGIKINPAVERFAGAFKFLLIMVGILPISG